MIFVFEITSTSIPPQGKNCDFFATTFLSISYHKQKPSCLSEKIDPRERLIGILEKCDSLNKPQTIKQ